MEGAIEEVSYKRSQFQKGNVDWKKRDQDFANCLSWRQTFGENDSTNKRIGLMGN